jgi:hypothetical protein
VLSSDRLGDVAEDGCGNALADASAVLAGSGQRRREDVMVRACSVDIKRRNDRAVAATQW